MQNKPNFKIGKMNISSAITVNYINKLRTTNYELIMKTNPNKPNFQTRETCPEPVERACPELVEGACPELVEGACPELVEGACPELVERACPERTCLEPNRKSRTKLKGRIRS